MIERWHMSVPCLRPDCDGSVPVRGYYDPGSWYGGPDGVGCPPEGEEEADACDTCGYAEWTDAEVTKLNEYAREAR